MTRIKTKRERVKFASDNVTGACPEVMDAILKANDGDRTPYGNDQISKNVYNLLEQSLRAQAPTPPRACGAPAG